VSVVKTVTLHCDLNDGAAVSVTGTFAKISDVRDKAKGWRTRRTDWPGWSLDICPAQHSKEEIQKRLDEINSYWRDHVAKVTNT